MGIIFDTPNFEFLKDKTEFRSFAQVCIKAEESFKSDPTTCVRNCRAALESVVKWVYAHDNRFKIDEKFKNARRDDGKTVGPLFKMTASHDFCRAVGGELLTGIHYIRMIGNNAMHGEEDFDLPTNFVAKPEEAITCLRNLFDFVQWVDRKYGNNYKSREFDPKEVPVEPSNFEKIAKGGVIVAVTLLVKALLDDNKR